ncbi:MAG: PilN domain-containing protein [Syntrophomonadaceae bacterium]|nr:PilN domain-containing protein [Syntrophomonadaceae bacterium]
MKPEQEYDVNLLYPGLPVGSSHLPKLSQNLFMIVFCLILVGWTGTWGWYALKERGQQAEIARLREQLGLAAEPQPEEQAEILRKSVAQKSEEIRRIRSGLVSCLEILIQIESSVPQGITLSEISIAGGELECKGTAADYLMLAEFISNLEQQKDIKEARCALAEPVGTVVGFQVQARITWE